MVPEGWINESVSFFGEINTGRQRAPSFTQGELRPYLRVANVFDGYIDASDLNFMMFTSNEFKKYQLQYGDILLNEGQSAELVGRPAMYVGIPKECGFQNTLVRFRANNRADPEFAIQRFRLCLYDGTFQAISKKTTSIAHLGTSRFAELKLAWPPLAEQKKIAKILSAWDQAITITEQLLENSNQQKKALSASLLTGRKRLPNFDKKWMECSFKRIFKERIETGHTNLPLLSITSDGGVINRQEVGRKDTSNADKSKYLKICQGDIGYNTMRMWQGVAGLSNLEGVISPAYTVLIPQPEIDPLYAAYLFKLPALIHIFYRHSQGMVSDTWNLKYSNFAKISWSIPDIQEQQSITSVLSIADREIQIFQKKLSSLKQEKKALMQQLLTGKRRVKVEAA
jgi:type I restriction enzyme S subunit